MGYKRRVTFYEKEIDPGNVLSPADGISGGRMQQGGELPNPEKRIPGQKNIRISSQ